MPNKNADFDELRNLNTQIHFAETKLDAAIMAFDKDAAKKFREDLDRLRNAREEVLKRLRAGPSAANNPSTGGKPDEP